MIKALLYWGSILVASTISYYYTTDLTQYSITHTNTNASNIDARIIDIQYRQYDDKGYLAQYMTTPVLIHHLNSNTHHLTRPHIMIREDHKKPWEISADYAIASQGAKHIYFYDNVRILQKKDHNATDDTVLQTQNLTYIPAQQIASTHSAVRITQAGNHIQATGLIADLNAATIRLLSDARGYYVHNTQ